MAEMYCVQFNSQIAIRFCSICLGIDWNADNWNHPLNPHLITLWIQNTSIRHSRLNVRDLRLCLSRS